MPRLVKPRLDVYPWPSLCLTLIILVVGSLMVFKNLQKESDSSVYAAYSSTQQMPPDLQTAKPDGERKMVLIATRTPLPTPNATPPILDENSSISQAAVSKLWQYEQNNFGYYLGNSHLAVKLYEILEEGGREADEIGFMTTYSLPGQFNAYRTIFNENLCVVATDYREHRDDRNVAMHFALVVPDAPAYYPPFIAYVGDVGPLQQHRMSFNEKNQAVIDPNGEPVILDIPKGCFRSYVDRKVRTSHGKVYYLTTEETLTYFKLLGY